MTMPLECIVLVLADSVRTQEKTRVPCEAMELVVGPLPDCVPKKVCCK